MYVNKQIYEIMSLLWDFKYRHVIINTSIIIYQRLYCIVLIIWGIYVCNIVSEHLYIYRLFYGHEHLNKNHYRDIYSPTTL